MIKKIVLWVIVIVIVGLFVAYFARNWLVKQAVEKAGTYALGEKTTLSSASLSLNAGRLGLSNLDVSNPEGYEGKDILGVKSIVLQVETGSILSKQVMVDSLVLDGLSIDLEQKNQEGNFLVILDHLKKVDLMSSSSGSHKFRIKQLAIRNISATASLSLLGQKQVQQSYTVGNITLQNVGSDGGATIGQIAATVIKAVLTKSVEVGKARLPGGFGNILSGGVQGALQNAESQATGKLKELGKDLIPKGK